MSTRAITMLLKSWNSHEAFTVTFVQAIVCVLMILYQYRLSKNQTISKIAFEDVIRKCNQAKKYGLQLGGEKHQVLLVLMRSGKNLNQASLVQGASTLPYK